MEATDGIVVRSTKGHDKGELMLLIHLDEKTAWVCDGRQRRLSKPKRKNPKHIEMTGFRLSKEDTLADKRLRKKLFLLGNGVNQEG